MSDDKLKEGILRKFREKIKKHEPIIGGGAGTGISAKCEEAGGIDLIVIYNSGRYRMAGRGSLAGLLPFGNANEIVKEMAYEVLTVVDDVPVLAGVCATDPFIITKNFLIELKELGFAGIQNFPTVGLFDGTFRENIESTGMSYQLEVDCVKMATQMGMITTPYAFNTKEAELMTKAGADIIVAHMGLTTKGTIGAGIAQDLDDCVSEIQAIVETCRSIRSDIIVLCHGGPIAQPEDAQYIFKRVNGINGFYGASSMERLPTEVAITTQIKKFKELSL